MMVAERVTEYLGEVRDVILCYTGIFPDQSGEATQGVEQKVWIDLGAQVLDFSVEIGGPQLFVLLFLSLLDTVHEKDFHHDGN